MFATWISTRTHMNNVAFPRRMPVSRTYFQQDGRKLTGYFCFGLVSPIMYFVEFVILSGTQFCTSHPPFVILPVLLPKYPFPLFCCVSSQLVKEPSFALSNVSVSMQILKQHFSRTLQPRIQVQLRLTYTRRMSTIQNFLLFKFNRQRKGQIVF